MILSTLIALNDTYFAGKSGAPSQFEESTQVQMLTADIKIQVPSGKVKTTYTFKNQGPATTIRMGFPEEGMDAYLDSKTKTHFKYFRSTIDGKPTTTTPVKRDDARDMEDFGYKIWWTKTVPFAANQTRTIVNEYQSPPGSNTMPVEFFQYIVHTASTWKGKINTLNIEIDTTGFKPGTRFMATPKGYKLTGNKVSWSYKNIEPNPDLNPELSWDPENAFQDGITPLSQALGVPIHIRPND